MKNFSSKWWKWKWKSLQIILFINLLLSYSTICVEVWRAGETKIFYDSYFSLLCYIQSGQVLPERNLYPRNLYQSFILKTINHIVGVVVFTFNLTILTLGDTGARLSINFIFLNIYFFLYFTDLNNLHVIWLSDI